MTASDFEMVNSFNGHFAFVFTTEDISSIPIASVSFVPSHNIFSDVNFTQHDVLQALSKLRVDKAAGPDEVSAHLLIEIKDNIAYPLFVIFRKSLDEGVVPDDWKSANISFVFKKGNGNVMDNYRPVSLTSQVCRVVYIIDSPTSLFVFLVQVTTVPLGPLALLELFDMLTFLKTVNCDFV